jgi:hypothetical protein
MDVRAAILVGSIIVVLMLGGFVTYVSVKAAQRTETVSLWALGAGIGLITAGTVSAELCLLGVPASVDSLETGVGVIVTLGFVALTYSIASRRPP